MSASKTTPSLPLPLHEVLEEEWLLLGGSWPAGQDRSGSFTEDQLKNVDLLANRLSQKQEPRFDYLTRAAGVTERSLARILENASLAAREHRQGNPAGLVSMKNYVAALLNGLLEAEQPMLRTFPEAPFPVSPAAREWAKHAATRKQIAQANRLLIEEALDSYVEPLSAVRLRQFNAAMALDPKGRSALCLSGGGIRSATFALGILQGLARRRLLEKFDFLSTVSGGGYIGSWLSAWIRRHRHGLPGVCEELRQAGDRSPQAPEPKPVRHLRDFSNYLSPRLGWFSGDTWTLAATYLRNLLLNWLVFLPLLFAGLLVPRLVNSMTVGSPQADWLRWAVLVAGVLFGIVSLAYVTVANPNLDDHVPPNHWLFRLGRIRTAAGFRYGFLLPLLACAFLITLWWGWTRQTLGSFEELFGDGLGVLPLFAFFGAYWHLAGWGAGRLLIQCWKDRPRFSDKFTEIAGVVVTGALAGVLIWWLVKTVFPNPDKLRIYEISTTVERGEAPANYDLNLTSQWSFGPTNALAGTNATPLAAGSLATNQVTARVDVAVKPPSPATQRAGLWPKQEVFTCTAVPAFLGVFLLAGVGLIGLRGSRHIFDRELEWYGRSGAWVLIVAVAWAGAGALSLFGSKVFAQAAEWVASAGGAAGLFTLLAGRGAKTPADSRNGKPSWMNLAVKLAAPAALVVLLAALSVGLSGLISLLAQSETLAAVHAWLVDRIPLKSPGAETWIQLHLADWSFVQGDLAVIHYTPLWLAAALLVLALLIAYVLGRRINCNRFSLHGVYRNRLVRAYLGASRSRRRPNWFTGLDDDDNLPMCQLRRGQLVLDHLLDPPALIEELRKPWAYAATPAAHPETPATPEVRTQRMQHRVACCLRKYFVERAGRLLCNIDDLPADQPPPAAMLAWTVNTLNRMMCDVNLLDVRLAEEDLILERGQFTPFRNFVRRFVPEVLQGPRTAVVPLFEPDQLPKELQGEEGKIVRKDVIYTNRLLLGAAFPDIVSPPGKEPFKPFHLVNTALNLVQGDQLAWQERKADSFTFSSLHCGNRRLGYRRAEEYTSSGPMAVSLGTALTISGAAASPNMGYHSSFPVAFLLTLFNVRLGAWLGNPGIFGQATYRAWHPSLSFQPLLAEALGNTNDRAPFVYLSDGGHFENLGLYEMVLRRCRFIVVSDAGADPRCALDDLGNAIRKIRIDLGVPIELTSFEIKSRQEKTPSKHCAVGRIRYDLADGNVGPHGGPAPVGTLICLKASLCGQEPRDVFNYKTTHEDFPHETTGDQFFSESQFESYRALGEHIIEELCQCPQAEDLTPEVFVERVHKHLERQAPASSTAGSAPADAPSNAGETD